MAMLNERLFEQKLKEKEQRKFLQDEFGSVFVSKTSKKEPAFVFTKESTLKMLKRENEIRLSDAIQEKYSKADVSIKPKDGQWELYSIDEEIREQVLKEFGFDPKRQEHMDSYLFSCGKYVNDPEIIDSVVWLKYHRLRKGDLKVGDKVPEDITVFTLEGKECSLCDWLQANARDDPLVILSGSIS